MLITGIVPAILTVLFFFFVGFCARNSKNTTINGRTEIISFVHEWYRTSENLSRIKYISHEIDYFQFFFFSLLCRFTHLQFAVIFILFYLLADHIVPGAVFNMIYAKISYNCCSLILSAVECWHVKIVGDSPQTTAAATTTEKANVSLPIHKS